MALTLKRSELARPRAPEAFVGLPGSGTHLSIRRGPGAVVCAQDRGTRLTLACGFLAFGPYLWWLLYENWARLGRALPAPALAGVVLLTLVGPLLMLRLLLRTRRLVIRRGDGRITFHEGLFAERERRVLAPGAIAALRIEQSWYDDGEGPRTPNYTLAAALKTGETAGLCITARRAEVEELGALLCQAAGLRLAYVGTGRAGGVADGRTASAGSESNKGTEAYFG